MVDPSKFNKEKKKKKKQTKETKKQKDNSKRGRPRESDMGDPSKDDRPDVYNIYEEKENFDQAEMDQGAKSMAESTGASADRAWEKASGSNIDTYIDNQKRELREMYATLLQDIRQMQEWIEDNKDDTGSIESFTLGFQMAIYNMAQMRAGVAEIFIERYGKTEAEAVSMTGQIAKEAGEKDAVKDIIDYLSEQMVR